MTDSLEVSTDSPPPLGSVLRALAHADRMMIVETLARSARPLTITEIASRVELTRFTSSHHLGILREAGLVVADRDGTRVFHALAGHALHSLEDWIVKITDACETAHHRAFG